MFWGKGRLAWFASLGSLASIVTFLSGNLVSAPGCASLFSKLASRNAGAELGLI